MLHLTYPCYATVMICYDFWVTASKIFSLILGDLMGPSIEGLDKLLNMPTGCGEQNMIGFAPNIYVMDYLTVTDQVNEKISRKAKDFMRSGMPIQ